MKIFRINEPVFYIKPDYYLEEVKVHYVPYQKFSFNKNEENTHPFFIHAIKNITERENYLNQITTYTVYDLYYINENGQEEYIENIEGDYIFNYYDEAVKAAEQLQDKIFLR